MSRGFVKEGDQEEPPMIPPRAALPEGVVNYVTPTGMEQLVQERETLQTEIKELAITDERERRRALAVIEGKLKILNERIRSARVLNPKEQPKEEVRFGATVRLQNKKNNTKQQFTIVGVDEADVTKSKIAFVAPIARAVTGSKKGATVDFKLGNEVRKLKILNISYG
ncbi:GreA/GreB family elongation factor [Marixanthomonas spongiae]|uniref:Transcription elongation factor GreA n=1 Tax=Marixanthomonas spongiae TaxID=2174845 RepID=A0A2U0I7Q1_9FLAO|nr:GreA/GreB family elongation factor [Marixanthomonas spongiae]PVW17133.1 transcription elongation factor GreA [Marixanthomonas spongiae]